MKSCKQRWKEHKDSCVSDLKTILKFERGEIGEEKLYREGLPQLHEYGLCFDYVAPGTFGNQKRGYYRYQISTGGPGEEFRYYPNTSPREISFVFLDWYDGYERRLRGKDWEIINEIFDIFDELGLMGEHY